MKNKSLFDSFSNALQGIMHSLTYERNFKIHFGAAIIVLIFSLFLSLSLAEYLIVLLIITLVLVTELINTSIESAIDLYCGEEYNHYAKIAKDCAAGAVFISSVSAIIVGYLLIFKKVIEVGLTPKTLLQIRQTPMHIILVCLLLTVMISVVIKVFTKSEHFFRGGMPSSHSALAFAGATCIFFLVNDTTAISLGYFLAFLVAQSRIEGKIHSYIQVIVGSFLGILITFLIFGMAS